MIYFVSEVLCTNTTISTECKREIAYRLFKMKRDQQHDNAEWEGKKTQEEWTGENTPFAKQCR